MTSSYYTAESAILLIHILISTCATLFYKFESVQVWKHYLNSYFNITDSVFLFYIITMPQDLLVYILFPAIPDLVNTRYFMERTYEFYLSVLHHKISNVILTDIM
jgi:hypothetical protein